MSTLVPPPTAKRQRKLNAALQSQTATWADPSRQDAHLPGHAAQDQGQLVIQFRNANEDNAPLGPPISIPAGAGQRELALLVNQLRRQLRGQSKKKRHVVDDINEELPPSDDDDDDDEDLPYSFHVAIPQPASADKPAAVAPENTRLTIATSIQNDVLASKPAAQLGWSTESLLDVVFEPQAVFRVRAVNRCSSSLTGHASPILCSTFSPSGRLLLTGSGDRTARIWDLTSESPLHTLTGHGNWVLCAEWEPRERKAATGDMDGVVFVWDALDASLGRVGRKAWGARSGEAVQREFEAAQAEATASTTTTDGEGGQAETSAARTKMTAAERRAARHAAPGSHAFRGHSKWVTSLSWEPLHLLEQRNEPLHALPRLASSSKDGTIRIWSLSPTRRCEVVLGGHTASVNVVRWGGEGLIYSASSDRSVRVWTPEGKTVRILQEHAHWVNTLALSTDYVLRTGPFDHLGEEGWEESVGGGPGSVGAEPGSGKGKSEDEWEAAARKRAKQRYVEATRPASAGAEARDELLISGSDDHTLFLWPPQSASASAVSPTPKKPIARLTGHQQTVNHVAFSPSGTMLASASFDKSVKLWNARTGKFVATLRAHVGAVYRLTWSADSRLLVSASKDSTVKVWDVARAKLKRDLAGHTDEVYCVDFAGDRVASGGRDRSLKIWKH